MPTQKELLEQQKVIRQNMRAREAQPEANYDGSSYGKETDKDSLVEEAVELGIAPRSTLQRWSVKRLRDEIGHALSKQHEE